MIPALNSLWRESDRQAVMRYAGIAFTESQLTHITSGMNSVAGFSPAAVTQCRAWIDEADALEATYAGRVAAGDAHLDSAKSYEGLRPGASVTREDMLSQADVLQWDTQTQYRVRFEAGEGASGTANGISGARIADLQGRVLRALGLEDGAYGGYGQGQLVRG
jgi:hypothetical protein